MSSRSFFPCPRRIVLAPMAGGPSTPELCAAVSEAGGLGFLAAGYLGAEKFREDLKRTEELTSRPFGGNLFVPDDTFSAKGQQEWQEYRERLLSQGHENLPEQPCAGDEDYESKLELLARSKARFVSFTFGYPGEQVIEDLHRRGKKVILYATSPQGVRSIHDSGADYIGLQGLGAGGHRATVHGGDARHAAFTAFELLLLARGLSSKPLIVGGGVGTARDVETLLKAGAAAVQVGTRFLTAHEAGTRRTHRQALLDLTQRPTVLTRAFSGKSARSISNRFIEENDDAPSLYPQIHHLTAGLRRAADEASDPENLNLWAGVRFDQCRQASAYEILEELRPSSPRV